MGTLQVKLVKLSFFGGGHAKGNHLAKLFSVEKVTLQHCLVSHVWNVCNCVSRGLLASVWSRIKRHLTASNASVCITNLT
jgi:hypothetical protein